MPAFTIDTAYPFAAIADVDIRQHEIPQLLEDFVVISAAYGSVEVLRKLEAGS